MGRTPVSGYDFPAGDAGPGGDRPIADGRSGQAGGDVHRLPAAPGNHNGHNGHNGLGRWTCWTWWTRRPV